MSTLFIDMDGVVADYDAGIKEILGYNMPEKFVKYPQEDWKKVLEEEHFFRNLPLCHRAEDLVEQCLMFAEVVKMDVKFLTAVPSKNDFPWVFNDKIEWAKEYFPSIPVWFGPYKQDKVKFVNYDNILIDDNPQNIKDWDEAGGFGILHETGNNVPTFKKLRDYFAR